MDVNARRIFEGATEVCLESKGLLTNAEGHQGQGDVQRRPLSMKDSVLDAVSAVDLDLWL